MKVLVGSHNPVKINSVKQAFSTYFKDLEVVGVSVPSQVSDQPFNDETYQGAENRVHALKAINEKEDMNAEFFVGIEGGISKIYSKWFCFGSMCIMDKEGHMGFGASSYFELPAHFIPRLEQGGELGDISSELTGEHNTKQKGGIVGFLTKGAIDRTQFYVPGLIHALSPFVHKDIFFKK